MSILPPRHQVFAFRIVVCALVFCAALAFVPIWAPLVLAMWVATMARPMLRRLTRAMRGRERAAGILVVVLVMAILVPVAGATISLSRGALDLGRSVLESKGAKNALIAVASGGQPSDGSVSLKAFASLPKIVALVQEHGAQAMQIVGGLAGAATEALLGIFVFVYAVYVFLVDGPAQYQWFESHAPLEVAHTRQLVRAFNETGRGLFVGVGLTGLAQGIVATVTYLALGVPRALVLGMLTCFASLLPSVGTALVWVPVAAGLAFAGKTKGALVMAAVGIFAIGTVDNIMRPMFARFGKLELSNFVLLLSIFGGLAAFGPWGLLLGPLFARLAKEALIIARVDRLRDKALHHAGHESTDTPAK